MQVTCIWGRKSTFVQLLQRFPVMGKPADESPQCPMHGPMKPSAKGKGWDCPTKLADGSWCKSR
jgi:hypothetical protein